MANIALMYNIARVKTEGR